MGWAASSIWSRRFDRYTTPLQGAPAAFWRPDLSFDGRRVLFCFHPEGDKSFHLYEVGVDGSGLRQLTFGNHDDLDPLAHEPGVRLTMLGPGRALPADTDVAILPGTKSTRGDLASRSISRARRKRSSATVSSPRANACCPSSTRAFTPSLSVGAAAVSGPASCTGPRQPARSAIKRARASRSGRLTR